MTIEEKFELRRTCIKLFTIIHCALSRDFLSGSNSCDDKSIKGCNFLYGDFKKAILALEPNYNFDRGWFLFKRMKNPSDTDTVDTIVNPNNIVIINRNCDEVKE